MTTERYEQAPVWLGYSGHPTLVSPPKRCVIVDLDGTLLNNEHRQHYMRPEKKNWAAFFGAMGKDTVYPEIKLIVDLVFKHSDIAVILITGRPSHYHDVTMNSLHELDVNFTSLVMRSQFDDRADRDVKLAMLQGIKHVGFEPILCIDDRPEVVHMWRENGVRTLQCDPSAWVAASVHADHAALVDENERLRERVRVLEGQDHPPKQTEKVMNDMNDPMVRLCDYRAVVAENERLRTQVKDLQGRIDKFLATFSPNTVDENERLQERVDELEEKVNPAFGR